jgi:KipI family sensor histidine kinase inhibitor
VNAPYSLVQAGDSVVVVELENRIDERINSQAIWLADAVAGEQIAGVRDVVPTYRSVAVYFDPLRTDYAVLSDLLERKASAVTTGAGGLGNADPERVGVRSARGREGRRVRIPVKYGGDDGPDLADVAAFARLSEAEVIARHTARVYRVFMMGFLPGFPYLGTVEAAIAAPRRSTPRLRVPEGSVGIAGAQTGIYPTESPGGWQIIGRTSVKLFDVSRSEPFLLEPGNDVEFFAER